MRLQTFQVRAEARVGLASNSRRVVWVGNIRAADAYAAGDRVKGLLKVRGGVYHVVLRFSGQDLREPSPEAAAIIHKVIQEVEDGEG